MKKLLHLALAIGATSCFSAPNTLQEQQLLQACWDGKAEKVEQLISDGGVDINCQDELGYTALILACEKGLHR